MKNEWKKKALAVCVLALVVSPLVAADVLPRSEWQARVGDCAARWRRSRPPSRRRSSRR